MKPRPTVPKDRTFRLSQAVEDYLKTIYKLQQNAQGAVATTDIARTVGVASASVTNMLKRLSGLGLVAYKSYKGVTLTPAGEKIALEIIRHHRLLETYLREILGYPWDKMHEEAEHLEHHISEEFETRIEEMLGYPTHDPHGHPIPTRDGRIAEAPGDPLTTFGAGRTVVVRRVADADPELLTHLEAIGLMPNALVEIVTKAADGPLTLRIEGEERIVGHEVARHVFAVPTEAE